jgi:hypothetical protein
MFVQNFRVLVQLFHVPPQLPGVLAKMERMEDNEDEHYQFYYQKNESKNCSE